MTRRIAKKAKSATAADLMLLDERSTLGGASSPLAPYPFRSAVPSTTNSHSLLLSNRPVMPLKSPSPVGGPVHAFAFGDAR
jgi:hypothetical protein